MPCYAETSHANSGSRRVGDAGWWLVDGLAGSSPDEQLSTTGGSTHVTIGAADAGGSDASTTIGDAAVSSSAPSAAGGAGGAAAGAGGRSGAARRSKQMSEPSEWPSSATVPVTSKPGWWAHL